MENVFDVKWCKGKDFYESRLEKYVRRGFDVVLENTPQNKKLNQTSKKAVKEIEKVFGFSGRDG